MRVGEHIIPVSVVERIDQFAMASPYFTRGDVEEMLLVELPAATGPTEVAARREFAKKVAQRRLLFLSNHKKIAKLEEGGGRWQWAQR